MNKKNGRAPDNAGALATDRERTLDDEGNDNGKGEPTHDTDGEQLTDGGWTLFGTLNTVGGQLVSHGKAPYIWGWKEQTQKISSNQ